MVNNTINMHSKYVNVTSVVKDYVR